MTANPIVEHLVGSMAWVHASLIRVSEDLDEGTFHRQLGPKAPSIAFHLWHTARWADVEQAYLPGAASELRRLGDGEELWASQGVATAWRMDTHLGWKGAGTGLDDDASAALALPDRETLTAYARDAFAAAETAFAAIRDDELTLPTTNVFDDPPWPLLQHFTFHHGHLSRHLGMMEALKGALGQRGTATI